MFKDPERSYIYKVIRVAQIFPIFLNDDNNKTLLERVFEDEPNIVISSFLKDKSPKLDGWGIGYLKDFLMLLVRTCCGLSMDPKGG